MVHLTLASWTLNARADQLFIILLLQVVRTVFVLGHANLYLGNSAIECAADAVNEVLTDTADVRIVLADVAVFA